MRKTFLFFLFLLFCSVSFAALPPVGIQDEGGTEVKPVFTINCEGGGVVCSHEGTTATIAVSGVAGDGAPPDAEYLVSTANGTLTAEKVVTANGLSLVQAANYAAMKTLLDTDDIQTLTGVAAGTAHLGTFTGSTITDSSTIKTALQELETSLETKGVGDVTSYGDCLGGACGDGTSDGGTYIRLYEVATGFYGQISSSGLAGNTTYTLPQQNGTLLTSGYLANSTALRGLLSDESGTGAAIFAGGNIGAATATTPAENDNDTSVATTAYVQTELAGISAGETNWAEMPLIMSAGVNWTDLEALAPINDDAINWNSMTDLASGGAVVWANLAEGELTDSSIVSGDIKDGTITAADTAITAGRSLTWSTNDLVADAELYTDTKCVYILAPVATDDLKSIWYAKGATTITSLWCESDQTVTAMLQVDDGSPADVDGTDLTCDSTPPEDTSLDGDATLAAGDRLDLDIASVSGTPTWVSICWTATYDD